MSSSTRQAIAGLLIVLVVSVCSRAQTTPVKDPTATITGKVTIKDKGAPGIVVGLSRNRQPYERESTSYRGVTNDDGEYRITNVLAGSYQVMPFAPAFVSSANREGKSLIVNKGETIENVDFSLVRGGVITGKVFDPDARPVVEEEVFAIPDQGSTPAYFASNILTDDRGIYRIFGLPAGRYRVGVGRDEGNSFRGRSQVAYKRTYYPSAADMAQATVIDVSEGSETTNIDINLTRTLTMYSVSGRIVDAETGQPLASLDYGITHFVSPNNTASWNNGAGSNAGGEFKFEGLLPGKYAMSIMANRGTNWRADPLRFEITDQDVTGLVIKASRGATISGVVILEGSEDKAVRDQLSRMNLGAYLLDDSVHNAWSNTSGIKPDGSFQILGLRSGLVNIYLTTNDRFRLVRVEQNGVIQPRGIELKDGQQLTGVRVIVQYANASVRGAIEFENGPLPENGRLSVRIKKPGEDERNMNFYDPSAQVDARGQFVIEGLLPGNYELIVAVYVPGSPPSFITKKQEIAVTAGAPNNVTIKVDLKSNTARPE